MRLLRDSNIANGEKNKKRRDACEFEQKGETKADEKMIEAAKAKVVVRRSDFDHPTLCC